MNLPNFTFFRRQGQKTTTFFFFSWTLMQSFRIQLQKTLPAVWRIERDGISEIKFEAAQIHLLSDVFVVVPVVVAWTPYYCRCSKWYLQCTESDPASEVAEPMPLFATHLYCPSSDRWTFRIVKKWIFPDFVWFRSGSAVMSSVTLSFVQSMLGSGFPSTVQLNIAVSPSIFTVLSGGLVNPGASETEKVQDNYSGRPF